MHNLNSIIWAKSEAIKSFLSAEGKPFLLPAETGIYDRLAIFRAELTVGQPPGSKHCVQCEINDQGINTALREFIAKETKQACTQEKFVAWIWLSIEDLSLPVEAYVSGIGKSLKGEWFLSGQFEKIKDDV